MGHVRLKTAPLRNHPQYNEKWLQNIIADDPGILGIGDVLLRDVERMHPGAGRLDLLLQEADGYGRYEVEIQLGATDESHIIRTIEYWDIERRRYPQYDHTAVIVAEDITSRFLNVIGLFNGFIPIMALQLTAVETAEGSSSPPYSTPCSSATWTKTKRRRSRLTETIGRHSVAGRRRSSSQT